MMFFISCRTTRVIEKTVYEVPEIEFPTFPKLPEYEYTLDGKVAVEGDFFRELLIFRTLYNSEMNKYIEIKELYSGGNKNGWFKN